MMAAMVHRGPDDDGYEPLEISSHGHRFFAGFGFRRLSILDLTASGHQPMLNPSTGDCLVFNGEIYNFKRLRAELQCEGILFRGNSDTEVLLHALSRWGEQALHKIQGMYAFAFYEAQTSRILLARDPLGIKPLYVAHSQDGIVFASEIQAIRASGLVDTSLDVHGIAGMLAYGAVQSPRTIYEQIRGFPAGHFQWVNAESISSGQQEPARRFWHFPRTLDTGAEFAVAANNVRSLLRDAVLRHLVADVPVGVFLSAGIDSTVIASFAREYTPRITAFTVGFGDVDGQDETALANETARVLGMRHVAVSLDVGSLPSQWRDWIDRMDSPSIDGFNTYVVSKRLAEEGVVVGLSGLGADELFGGYQTFSIAPRLARLLGMLQFVHPSLRAGAVRALGMAGSRTGAFEKLADVVSGNQSIIGLTQSLRRTLSNHRLSTLGIDPALVTPTAYESTSDHLSHAALGIDSFNLVSRSELTHYMGDTLLRDTDTTSMVHSLEVRVPFLDQPLIDYVSSLPGRLKRRDGTCSKGLLREACKSVIRSDIANRPKTGFSLPIDVWMRGEMRDSCEAAIGRLEQLPFLEKREVRRIWTSFLADRRSLHWSRPLSLVVLGGCIG